MRVMLEIASSSGYLRTACAGPHALYTQIPPNMRAINYAIMNQGIKPTAWVHVRHVLHGTSHSTPKQPNDCGKRLTGRMYPCTSCFTYEFSCIFEWSEIREKCSGLDSVFCSQPFALIFPGRPGRRRIEGCKKHWYSLQLAMNNIRQCKENGTRISTQKRTFSPLIFWLVSPI